MKTVKAELTKLKHKFENEFSRDSNFLKIITFTDIIQEINNLYPMIEKLENVNNKIEITYIKRCSLKLITNIHRLVKKPSWNSNEELRMMGYFIRLKNLIKQSYLLEVKGQIRSEEELSALASDIETAKAKLAEHTKLETQLVKDRTEFQTLKTSLTTLKTSYDTAQSQANEIAEWYEKSDTLSSDISSYATTAQNNLTKITTLATTAETNKPKIEKYHTEIEEMIKLFNKQKEEIQEIIEDANRASMAGSFKTQAENINEKMKNIDKILLGSLIATSIISFINYSTSLSTQDNLNILQFLAKSIVTIPLLVIAWLKAKERAYLFRLREDYNYKYSSAMAFEGYKKQVQEQDPALHQQLLQIAVDNLGVNPTKVFERDLKSTPLETIIDGVGKRLDKAVEGIKGQVKDIPQKTKELIDE
ncbi:hypothetical protein ABWE90_01350 [Pasteurella multocida]|uniref:hypothetical protein n=1 Tax=Pasteurella multocida TaxID=747 RepID=UPI0002E92E51|nr:hypothetical protein [Pasteurella multocida]ARB76767.2 hypothetical protein A6J57_09600 [Pasteurella multocida]NMR53044.1 hypothetical protein [Pasteurella multocida]NMR62984.1 hypothetical protein [Pasteurella multocida]OBP30575.1 hypothetical protein A0R67_04105 [Pasteurella multocida subsp. multocida]URK10835.1 hypothetical protein M9410_05155 [Pasteurella multocida]